MQITHIEVYSQESHAGVVRLPNRRLPGLVVQGESLVALCDLARQAPAGEQSPALADLEARLERYLRSFERVLKAHDIDLRSTDPNARGTKS